VAEQSIDGKKEFDDLKMRRTRLFEKFSKNPAETRLALGIKVVDDQLADYIEQAGKERGKRSTLRDGA
jgi:hypothetical protein